MRAAAERIIRAERSEDSWVISVRPPLSLELGDDPLRQLERDTAVTTQAELVAVTADEDLLSPEEAWAWLATLQVALRATADAAGLVDEEQWGGADPIVRDEVEGLQTLLWGLADCL